MRTKIIVQVWEYKNNFKREREKEKQNHSTSLSAIWAKMIVWQFSYLSSARKVIATVSPFQTQEKNKKKIGKNIYVYWKPRKKLMPTWLLTLGSTKKMRPPTTGERVLEMKWNVGGKKTLET